MKTITGTAKSLRLKMAAEFEISLTNTIVTNGVRG